MMHALFETILCSVYQYWYIMWPSIIVYILVVLILRRSTNWNAYIRLGIYAQVFTIVIQLLRPETDRSNTAVELAAMLVPSGMVLHMSYLLLAIGSVRRHETQQVDSVRDAASRRP